MNIFVFILLTTQFRDSSNVRLIGWWPYSHSNTVVSTGNYTYLGSGFGIYVLNTGNPNSPQLINQIPTNGEVNRLLINGNYLYCANGAKGLKIFEIMTPESLILIGGLELNGDAKDTFIKDSFAYVGTSGLTKGLWIINISNPALPVLRGTYFYSGSWGCCGVEVKDTFAYIAANTLKILNVANPSTPQLIDSILTVGFCAMDVEICDSFLYFTEYGLTNYFRVANIANPTNPIVISNRPFYHPIMHIDVKDSLCYVAHYITFYIINVADPYNPYTIGLIPNCGGSDVSVCDSVVYLTGGKLRVIAVSDPQNPYVLTTFRLPGSINNISVRDSIACLAMEWNGLWILNINNPSSPSELGKLIFVTKDVYVKDNLGCCVGDSGLGIVDISDPGHPVLLSNFALPYDAGRGVVVSDTICYIANGYGGLRIINIADPLNPVELGSYPSSSHTWDVAVHNNIAYIADHNDGLKIIDVSNPSSPILLSQMPYTGYQTMIVEATSDTIYVVTNSSYGYLRIIDTHNPVLPVELGLFYSHEPISSVKAASPYVYIVTQTKLTVVNVSNPTNPVEVGYYDLPAAGYSCGIYNNHILVGTYLAGLMFFDYYGAGIIEQKTGNLRQRLFLNNPVRNEVLIRYHGKNDEWINTKIYDIQGRLLFKTCNKLTTSFHFKKINLEDFSPGVYFLIIETKEKQCIRKFVLLR